MKISSRWDWADETLIITLGTNTLMGPHEIIMSSGLVRRDIDFYIVGPHEIIISSGLVRRNIDFYIGESTLMGPHEIIMASGLVRRNNDFYIGDKDSDGTT